ncbi:MAG: hypothetical protein V4726_05660 [Verrucomicrobiota bacterium]
MASLPESHFWNLTPGETDEILREAIDEWRARERSAAYGQAMIVATLYNCHRDPKKHPEPFTPEDFLPRQTPPQPPREPTSAEVATKIKTAMKTVSLINSQK